MKAKKLDEILMKQLQSIYKTLDECGIDGIYSDFQDPADAIQQMAYRIKELEENAA